MREREKEKKRYRETERQTKMGRDKKQTEKKNGS